MKSTAFVLGLVIFLGTSGGNQTTQSQATTLPVVKSAATQPANTPTTTKSTNPTPAIKQSANQRSGMFVNGEHETLGGVRVFIENGIQFIEFDQAFKTDNGPDLYVILTREKQPPIMGIKEQDYRSLGLLQRISGTQRYTIPSDLNLSEFAGVAIWCRQFNATFGYAQLNS
jgi:hypothetical protein